MSLYNMILSYIYIYDILINYVIVLNDFFHQTTIKTIPTVPKVFFTCVLINCVGWEHIDKIHNLQLRHSEIIIIDTH
jgi:hypothetical protein